MRNLLILFFMFISPVSAETENDDYSAFDRELKYLEEAAKKEEEKLLLNVDKISEEKVESPIISDEAFTDTVSTKLAAEGAPAAPLIPPPPVERPKRIRSR